jgi:large subunit ribosomal protein L23
MNISQVIIRPVLTEKSVQGNAINKYTFVVGEDVTKVDVKQALHELYGVQAAKVNILKGLPKYKMGRSRRPVQKRRATRRAIVTLKSGQKLDISKLKTKSTA